MKVYFIILCWNNRDLLDECLSSIKSQDYKDYSVLIVDNGSTDDSVEYIKRDHPEVKLIETGKNDGFAIGNNIGIAEALKDPSCKYIAFINTDARIKSDWLKTLISFADSHPNGASFQSPTVDYYDHKILDSYGIQIDKQGRAVQLGFRTTTFPKHDFQVYGANAAAAMYSRAFLNAQPFGTDYFDSDLWMYLEDVDLATRAVIMGWESWLVHGSLAYHMGSASSGKNPGFSVFMSYRNNLPTLVKNMPFTIMIRILPGLIFTDMQTLLTLLRARNFKILRAILKGRFASLSMLPLFIRKHYQLKKKAQLIPSSQLWKLLKRHQLT